MKDFAKSIRTGNSKVGNGLNPGEYTVKTSPKDPHGNYEVTVTLKSGEVKKFRGLEAVDEAYKWIRSQKTGNSKVENANVTPVSKPNAPIKDPKKEDKEKDKDKKTSDPKDKEGYTFKERVKQVTGNSDGTEKLFYGLEKDVEEKEDKNDEEIEEVGNSKAGEKNVWKEGPYHIEQLTEDGNFGWYKMPKGSFVAYRNDVVYGNFKTLDEAKRKLQDEINKDKEYNRKYTTNSKTGNSLYAELNKDGKRVVIEENGSWYVYDKSGNIYEQGHESNADNALGKWKAKGYNKKIVNAGYPVLKSKVEELSKEGKSYEEVVKELLKFGFTRADIAQYEGYIREHIGNNKVSNSNYRYKGYLITKSDEDGEIIVFKPNGRDVAFRGTKSEDMGKDWIDHHSVGNKEAEKDSGAIEDLEKVGNSNVGNIKDSRGNELGRGDFIFVEVPGYGKVYVKIKQINGSSVTVTGKEIDDMDYTLPAYKIAGALKWGNSKTADIGNSASDDKFAYVMREFDEGKLKTPDGKVVTDPAQAKAIAYSESKKTENGCARARNAMNNSVFTYKGYTIRYRPNTSKYYISSGPNDTYVAKFAYKEYSSEQDAKDAIDGVR